MSFISEILASGVKEVLAGVDTNLARLKDSPDEKRAFKIELEELLEKRDSEIEESIRVRLGAKERVLVAELKQGDNYTKRARPSVVYAGLGFIFINYCLVPLMQSFTGSTIKPFELPTEFCVAWGCIVSTWVIGRTAEKRGVRNKAVSLITGSAATSSLLDEPKG